MKKILSVVLAVIMIMSSMSVCFGTFGPVITVSAADSTTAVNNFVSAVDEYAKKVGKFTEFGYSYDNKNYVKTWTYNATYWSEFNIVCNVIDKLHAAVMGLDEYTISATHNDNKLCGDGYNSSTQENKCTDWGYVKDALIKAMGTNYKTLQSTASIDYLLDAVLNYKEVPTAGGDDRVLLVLQTVRIKMPVHSKNQAAYLLSYGMMLLSMLLQMQRIRLLQLQLQLQKFLQVTQLSIITD